MNDEKTFKSDREPLLVVKDLRKSFGETQVLKGVSFELHKGEVLSIIGPSGGGKSTLLRCLNFLETPEGGTIAVGGETLFDASAKISDKESDLRTKRLHFGLVFQSFNLFPHYNALENVALAPSLQGGDYRKKRREAKKKNAALLAAKRRQLRIRFFARWLHENPFKLWDELNAELQLLKQKTPKRRNCSQGWGLPTRCTTIRANCRADSSSASRSRVRSRSNRTYSALTSRRARSTPN